MPLSTTDAEHTVALATVLADLLDTHCDGIDRDTVAAIQHLPYLGWCMAADRAHIPPPSPAVCANVITLLKLRLENQDPFENFGLRVVQ